MYGAYSTCRLYEILVCKLTLEQEEAYLFVVYWIDCPLIRRKLIEATKGEPNEEEMNISITLCYRKHDDIWITTKYTIIPSNNPPKTPAANA